MAAGLIVITGVLIAVTASAAPAAPAAPARVAVAAPVTVTAPAQPMTVSVLQLNICHSGIAGCYAGDAVLVRAVEVIGASRPDVLSVNEACAGDVGPLREAMGAAVAMFVAAEQPDGAAVTCRNGQAFGNIVMVAATLGAGSGFSGRYTAQDPHDEMRVWGCLPAQALTACTTHLTSLNARTAFTQCQELMSHAVIYAAFAPVVISGDMNLHSQGNPNAQNCDPTGFYRKGDGDVQQVFATTNLTYVAGTLINMSGTTDHPAWLVTLRRVSPRCPEPTSGCRPGR